MRLRAAVDVQHQILGAGQMECLFCYVAGQLKDFGRWVTKRGGLTIVHCECNSCHRSWRRIECEG